MTDQEGVQYVAGSLGLTRVVANLRPLLVAVQRLDTGVDVQHPGAIQPLAHRVHQCRAHPRLAGTVVDALQRPAQRVLADHLVHAQRLCGHRVPAQRGDMRIASVPRQQCQHQCAQHIALARRIATAVAQRALRYPTIEYPRGSQKLSEEHQLSVRRGRRRTVPAHMHATAQRVHHLRLRIL